MYQNICVLITVILVKGWAEPGHQEECGDWQESTLRAPAAHRSTLPHPGPLVSWLEHWHDWNLSTETRGTWPRAVSHLPVTCRHVLSVIGTLWCVNISWPLATEAALQPETAQQRRDLLASQLGSWEKRKVCFNLLLHLHFDICGQFRFRFWQMSVPANRELCVFCKIRLMGDWRTEIGSRLTQEQRTTQDSHKCVAEVSSWYSNLFLVSLKLCVLQLR